MTTIGTAVLQIIPSLQGVTEAIEKQLPKDVPVVIEPQVDRRAAEKAGKTAGEAVTKSAKDEIRKGDIGKTIGDEVTTSVKRSSPGKEAAKVIVDGIADGVKGELRDGGIGEVIVDGIADGVKQGIDGEGVGGVVVDAISSGIESKNLGAKIKDAVLPHISEIGTAIRSGAQDWSGGIVDALRSGDIAGATSTISTAITNTTDLIGGIGQAFGVNTEAVETWGSKTSGVVDRLGTTFDEAKTQVDNIITPLQTFTDMAGPDSKLYAAGQKLPIVGDFLTLVPALKEANTELENFIKQKTGLDVPLSGEAWLRQMKELWPSASDNAQAKLDEALRNARTQGPPPAPTPQQRRDWVDRQFPFLIPGRAGGGYTGNMAADRIAGVVHGGEYVIRKSSTDRLEKNYPGLLGMLNGYQGGGLVAGAAELRRIISERFGISDIGGWRPADKAGEHVTGRALDVMVGNNKAKGDAIKDWVLANASAMDLKWVIWRQHLYYPGGGGYDMTDRGNPTQNHMDHVHIFSGDGISKGLLGALGKKPASSAAPAIGESAATGTLSTPSVPSAAAAAAPASSSALSSISMPSTIGGLSGWGLSSLPNPTAGLPDDSPWKQDSAKMFAGAGAAAIEGQVSAALGVFGVPNSPGWLQGISRFVSGIQVSKTGGSSAAPKSAAPRIAAPPDLGGIGGNTNNPSNGPQVNYNIRTATVEDAFTAARRKEDERARARLSRY